MVGWAGFYQAGDFYGTSWWLGLLVRCSVVGFGLEDYVLPEGGVCFILEDDECVLVCRLWLSLRESG